MSEAPPEPTTLEPPAAPSSLAGARQELLDLGLRNTLINYRTLTSRGVDVVDERPPEIFKILVSDGKNMSFEAAPDEVERAEAGPEQPEDRPTGKLAARHTDRLLQTGVNSAELQKRLLNSYHWARTSLEEQGVSVLYIALGMLEWYEDKNADRLRRAPLLLVPVELERSNARDRFHVQYTGEDIGENLSLAEKLASEYGVTAPAFPEIDDLDVDAYLAAWAQAIAEQPRWRVNSDAVALGFFSFGKFLMYRDLDEEVWPEELKPADHEVVGALLGDGFENTAPAYPDDTFVDRVVQPDEIHQVVDADSSQTMAILEANSGRNLVIQGPPGTGKSQTITNIIAESLAAGKTVLFVSEKMAALDVVKRRLDAVGIGDACLELHSHRTNKRSLLNELQRTLELGSPVTQNLQTEMQLLEDAQQRLNAYCTAVNLAVGETGITPSQAYGRLLQRTAAVSDIVWPKIEIESLREWQEIEFERRAGIVVELQARVAAMGPPQAHPYYGLTKTVLLPSDKDRIFAALDASREQLAGLDRQLRELAEALGLPEAQALDEGRRLVEAARAYVDAPQARPDNLADERWRTAGDELRTALTEGRALTEIRERWDEPLIPEIWDRDLLEIRQTLVNYESKWWRFLSGDYRSAKKQLAGFGRGELPTEIGEQVGMIDQIMEWQRLNRDAGNRDALGTALFGSDWRGARSNWDDLDQQAKWAQSLHAGIDQQALPAATVTVFDRAPEPASLTAAAEAAATGIAAYTAQLQELLRMLEIDPQVAGWDTPAIETWALPAQRDLLDGWSTGRGEIDQVVALNVALNRCREEGIAAVAELAVAWPHASERLADAFHVARNEAVIERALTERSALRDFDGAAHTSVAERFQQLDETLLRHNRHRLAETHWKRLPRHQGGGQLATLRREFEKKSRHLPIRRLIENCGNAVQAIKPVFMMSPMSIATYLPPGSVTFDVVIFDEASQVRPAEALGALLRGQQAIVVGDSKQLPPTSFFDTLTHGDDISDEDPVTRDIESILGLFAAQNTLQKMLRWHYRSRHESLITVSNYEFYDSRLVVFPSPDAGRAQLGLVYHHLSETAYERGRSRSNPGEARAVAEAVIAHAKRTPDLTLGVAAFSTAQAQAIIDELELLRRNHPETEHFFSRHEYEPFFVKNLENVQGDERDVIFISVGYGRDEQGKLTMNFGPLNNDGGERRLNVLITRARQRCEIFTNLHADDIDLSRTQARGVAAFKRYLKYAATGDLELPEITGRDMDSPFEVAVYNALVKSGYEVQPQVGSAGFYIDLAVVDPERPGRFLLGIECDGATYHSARSARDRDRLRQQVLEGLGWTIHRIWSTDWFRNPEGELRKVIAAIERARAAGVESAPPVRSVAQDTSEIRRQGNGAADIHEQTTEEYQLADIRVRSGGRDIHEIPAPDLARALVAIVQVEGPIHIEDAGRRILEAEGVGRMGSRIRDAIDAAARLAVRQGEIEQRNGFLWPPGMETPPVRDRSGQDGTTRRIDLIAPEEIAAAILQIVRESYGINHDDIAQHVGRLLGFQRVTANIRDHIEPVIERLIADESLAENAGFLTVTD